MPWGPIQCVYYDTSTLQVHLRGRLRVYVDPCRKEIPFDYSRHKRIIRKLFGCQNPRKMLFLLYLETSLHSLGRFRLTIWNELCVCEARICANFSFQKNMKCKCNITSKHKRGPHRTTQFTQNELAAYAVSSHVLQCHIYTLWLMLCLMLIVHEQASVSVSIPCTMYFYIRHTCSVGTCSDASSQL